MNYKIEQLVYYGDSTLRAYYFIPASKIVIFILQNGETLIANTLILSVVIIVFQYRVYVISFLQLRITTR